MARQNDRNAQGGFSLIEMAIVIILSGLFTAMALQAYKNQTNQNKYKATLDTMDVINNALYEYYLTNGRYPCPADPNLAQGDLGHGDELCRADPVADPCPAGLVCETFGARDADGDGNADPVMIGALPVTTLMNGIFNTKIGPEDEIDGYGMKFTYAVSELMTSSTYDSLHPASGRLGAISVRDGNGRSVVTPDDSAQYVIFSHGEDEIGAYTKGGDAVGGCIVTATTLPPVQGYNPGTAGIETEKENCDNNDAIFVKELQQRADDDNYYDDVLMFGIVAGEKIWQSYQDGASNQITYNVNPGFVGAEVSPPLTELHVGGNIRIKDAAWASGNYCGSSSTTTGDCVDPNFIGGTGDSCPSGQAVTGIDNNTLVCGDIFPAGPVAVPSCPSGQFLTGFSNLGTAQCATP